MVGLCHLLHQEVSKVVVNVCPCVDDLIVAFGIGDEAHLVVGFDLVDFSLSLADDACLLLGDNDIVEVERQTGSVGHAITQVLDAIEECAGTCHADRFDDIGDDATQGFL